jgi:hypothetical protein
METERAIKSHSRKREEHDLGRKPSENPKDIQLGIRVDAETLQAIDDEIDAEEKAKPGLSLGRSDMIRMFIAEAIKARRGRRSK